MTLQRKEPGQQQPWYSICWNELIRSPHVKGLPQQSTAKSEPLNSKGVLYTSLNISANATCDAWLNELMCYEYDDAQQYICYQIEL